MICLKTFQSILNFLNFGWVILPTTCGDTTCGGVTGAHLVNEGAVILFSGVGRGEVGGCSFAFKMHKIPLITVILILVRK